MLTLPPINVPATVGGISTGQSLLALDMSNGLTLQLDGNPGDSCAVYCSGLAAITSLAQAVLVAIHISQAPVLVAPPPYAYLYAVRTGVASPPAIIPLSVTGQETAGTATPSGGGVTNVTASLPLFSSGGPAPNISFSGTPIMQGGQSLGATMEIGTTDAHDLLIEVASTPVMVATHAHGDVSIGGSAALQSVALEAGPGGVVEADGALVLVSTTVIDSAPPVPTGDPIPLADIDGFSFLLLQTTQPLQSNGAPYLRLLPPPSASLTGRLLYCLADPGNNDAIGVADATLHNTATLAPGQLMVWSWNTSNNAWEPSATQYPVLATPSLGGTTNAVRLSSFTVYNVTTGGGGPATITAQNTGAFPGDVLRFIVTAPTNPVTIQNASPTTMAIVDTLTGNQRATVDLIFTKVGGAGSWQLLASSVPVS